MQKNHFLHQFSRILYLVLDFETCWGYYLPAELGFLAFVIILWIFLVDQIAPQSRLQGNTPALCTDHPVTTIPLVAITGQLIGSHWPILGSFNPPVGRLQGLTKILTLDHVDPTWNYPQTLSHFLSQNQNKQVLIQALWLIHIA